MPAYIHAQVEVIDAEGFEEYRRQVPAVIAAFGGRYLARGGATELLEGEGAVVRQVLVEFPDMAALKAFYHSPEYAPLIALRQKTTRSRLVAIQGL